MTTRTSEPAEVLIARKMKLEEMARGAAEAIAMIAKIGAKPVSTNVSRPKSEPEQREHYAM